MEPTLGSFTMSIGPEELETIMHGQGGPPKFGVWDTVERAFLGGIGAEGPQRFHSRHTAEVAAMALTASLGYPVTVRQLRDDGDYVRAPRAQQQPEFNLREE